MHLSRIALCCCSHVGLCLNSMGMSSHDSHDAYGGNAT